MNNELLVKLQEKLGGVLDLMTFDNAEKAVQYVISNQIGYHLLNMVIFIIASIPFIIVTIIYKNKRYKLVNSKKYNYWNDDEKASVYSIVTIIMFGIGITLFVMGISEIIIALQWKLCPIIKLYEFIVGGQC